ncbi:MAG: class II aldolase/adducin family protein [Negativicutes bacterium]|nr:class II aldolase/adducin family protein [Negativicutes bacterium]
MNPENIKEQICEIGRRMYAKGFVASNDGNITVKIAENEIWTTPTGVSKGYMTPDMLVKVNMAGEILEGSLKPSSELKLHLKVYRERSDVNAVIHAHPPISTAFTIAGKAINDKILSETIIQLGSIPTAKFGTPSTMELPDSITEYLPNHDAILLAHHGAITMGFDLFNAFCKMETLEFSAQISLYAKLLGNELELSSEQVQCLIGVRQSLNLPGRHPGLASGK